MNKKCYNCKSKDNINEFNLCPICDTKLNDLLKKIADHVIIFDLEELVK